jgi:U32 family peptidase
MQSSHGFQIVAPVNRVDEIIPLVDAGANEIYCGVLPQSWSAEYGEWDSLTRRQGEVANLTNLDQLAEIARRANELGILASLTLNVRYTEDQLPEVLAIASTWEDAGGASVIVSDPGVLLALQHKSSRLFRHISILANVVNSRAIEFFLRLGATRIILPRELSVPEMAVMISRFRSVDYEAMALNDKCRFADGLCGFYHGRIYPADGASVFSYERTGQNARPSACAVDLCYTGHGCQILFNDEYGNPVHQPHQDDIHQPSCAACRLAELQHAGVRYLKIGGRGLPTEVKLRAVAFIRDAAILAGREPQADDMRTLYRTTFGSSCTKTSCYYATPS